jgi:uncharacterized protein YidB (DUF937 family)
MGLLDAVVGALGQGGGAGGGGNPLLGALISMLAQGGQGGGGGGGGVLGQVLGSALGGGGSGAGMGGGMGSGMGGLGALLEQLQRGGLGEQAASWVGRGENLPISADQLSQVLGGDTLGKLAQQLGMGQGEVAGQLSQMLPEVVDRLTPDGQLPADGGLANLGNLAQQAGLGDLGSLVGGFLKR